MRISSALLLGVLLFIPSFVHAAPRESVLTLVLAENSDFNQIPLRDLCPELSMLDAAEYRVVGITKSVEFTKRVFRRNPQIKPQRFFIPTVKSLDPKELESSPIFISDGITKGCHARVYVNKREEFKQVKAQLAILGSAVKKIGFGWIIVDNENRSPLLSTLRNRDRKSFEKDASDPQYSQGTLTRHRIPSSYHGLSQSRQNHWL